MVAAVSLAAVLGLLLSAGPSVFISASNESSTDCSLLLLGQYTCLEPQIDSETQQPVNCSRAGLVTIPCMPTAGITCGGITHTGSSVGFNQTKSCRWTNGKSYKVTVLLSVFLGMFGIDRFYLGYPAIGLLKLATFGFMLVGQLVDLLLIAMQVVKPADGSDYVTDFYGPGLTQLKPDNSTVLL